MAASVPLGIIAHSMKYRIACILVCLGFLNINAFMFHNTLIGGSAGLGKVENGKYYVGSHGHYTEVSKSAFQLDKWLEASSMVSILIIFLFGLNMVLSKRNWGDLKWSDCRKRKKRPHTNKAKLTNR